MDTWVHTLRGEPGPYSRGAAFFAGDGRMVVSEPDGEDMKITPTMATIAAVFTLGGCDRLPPPAPDLSICWAPDTKTKVTEMFQSQVVEYIAKAINDGTTEANKKDAPTRDEIKGRVTVTLDMLHVTGADAASGRLTCGANIAIQFRRRGDEKLMSASASSPDFQIYKGEKGPVYSAPGPILLKPLLDKME